jgi:hypothetical protein
MTFAARVSTETTSGKGAYLKSGSYYSIAFGSTSTVIWAINASTPATVFITAENYETYTWLTGQGPAAGYSIRYTPLPGRDTLAGASSATGVWLSLSSGRSWSLSVNVGQMPKSASGVIEISDSADNSVILATATVYLDAEALS